MAEAAALLVDEVFSEQPVRQWVLSFPYPLTDTIARYLERQGLLECDAGNSWLAGEDPDDDPMSSVLGHSITYRIAVGPDAGRKVMTLQTLPADDPPFGEQAGKVGGFSLHAGVAARTEPPRESRRLVCLSQAASA